LALSRLRLPVANDRVAEKPAPQRPVLIATAHYERDPERSFVGSIRPRIESDMGFRVSRKVAKRLVGSARPSISASRSATLDEVDLKLQASRRWPNSPRDRRAGAGLRRRAARQGLRAKGWTTDAKMDSGGRQPTKPRACSNQGAVPLGRP